MTISNYDSVDEMFDAIRAQMGRANEQVLDWQAALKPGDKFMYVSHGIPIAGEVLPNAGVTEEELAAMDPEDAEGYREEAAVYEEPSMRFMRFTRCFSEVCPHGEMGDVHVSLIKKVVSESTFRELRASGWDLETMRRALRG